MMLLSQRGVAYTLKGVSNAPYMPDVYDARRVTLSLFARLKRINMLQVVLPLAFTCPTICQRQKLLFVLEEQPPSDCFTSHSNGLFFLYRKPPDSP
ncbi:hypothetical protein EYF80_017673 [Liparis tanakae]|uniref:Uncharacterized protein n=1 Tax=Liparis tanakae TaxID=230148 RepID=A0A4Z2I1Z2_9TELE|nr:hypothetical protein EYF80_017673 [Liparis tanakae]